jgi:hypothetical protein
MKKPRRKKLLTILERITRKTSPHEVQTILAIIYGQYARGAESEVEHDFWHKCNRASKNLASGMNKWLVELSDDLEENEED